MSDIPSASEKEKQITSALADRIRQNARQTCTSSYEITIPDTIVSFEMTAIPEGEFLMGSPQTAPYSQEDEYPQHRRHIPAFWMQSRPVTWDEFHLFMFASESGSLPGDELVDAITRPTKPYVDMSFGMGIQGYPAIGMTQHAASKYAQWLSAKTGEFFRLPTEAEWEYACRAGTSTPFFFGNDISHLPDYAWFADNSDGGYHTAGTKKPNPWGLYDMLGNVLEWTLDQYAPYADTAAVQRFWVAPTQPYPIAVRGGSWVSPAEDVRCAARFASDPSWKRQDPQLPKSIWYFTDAPWVGFRLVRPAALPSEEEMFLYWNNGVESEP